MDLKFREKCDKQGIIYSNQNQIEELQSLLPYSEKMVDSFLSKVKRNTDIAVLIDFCKNLKERESLLEQLTDGKTVNDLDKSISLLGVERCIQANFPKWNYELAANIPKHSLVDIERKFLSNVSSHKYFSKYSQAFEEYKELLNETLVSENHLFLQRLLYDLNISFLRLISNLDSLEKIERKLDIFIKSLDSENKIIELIQTLEILNEWNIDVLESEAFDIILNSTELNIRQNIHNFVLSEYFSETYEKSLDQLIDELITYNSTEEITILKRRENLKTEYQRVMRALDAESSLNFDRRFEGSIRTWNKSLIGDLGRIFWLSRMVKHFYDSTLSLDMKAPILSALVQAFPSASGSHDLEKAQKFSDFITTSISKYERLALIIRALELTIGTKLRDVQILSLILLLDSKKNKGRLAQISTGEGKTVIIAALAAYFALDGRKVDIITSSKLLVYPQLNELKDFYEALRLSVSHNFESYKAYLSDIVYGTSSEFQGDILRDEFRKLKTRDGRKCDVAIVDEVDNMLIDGNDHIVYLSCTMPGMDHLETLLAVISVQVKAVAASLKMHQEQLYFVQCENAIDERGEIRNEIVENYIPIDVSAHEFMIKATELHLRKLIRDCDELVLEELGLDYPEIKVPKHLRKLIRDVQLKKWIEKAIQARVGCTNKEDYILDQDEVKIVDAENTGVVHDNTQWSDGLHQFIQIKHGACLTPENFTTNFISNVSYFRRFRPDIYGLTGTLGCEGTREFLKNTYDVDNVIIPSFKLKQHQKLKAIVVENEEDWLRTIVKNSLQKMLNGRAVLIIMEYIRQVEAVEKIFIDDFNCNDNSIKLYKTDEDSDVVEELLNTCEVLITTNIAGRGADIRVHKNVEKNGGLHVCLTFLPKNSRVEEQNIGRTSRTGNRGTSQFILNNTKNIMTLQKRRAQKEAVALAEATEEVERVTIKDDIFYEFCKLTDILNGRNEFVKEIEREAVEECFAIWLKLNEMKLESRSRSEVFKLFSAFREEILEDEERGKLVKNAYMFIKIGNKYLEGKEYVKAIEEYTMAIGMDPDFAEYAHLNRGCAYIAQYGEDLAENVEEIDEAIRDFQRSRELIEDKEHNLHLMQNASENRVYSRQISNKLNLYNILKSAIEIAIGPDKKAIDRTLRDLRDRQSKCEKNTDDWTRIAEIIGGLEEKKQTTGVIQEAQDNERELRIKFISWKECLPIADDSYDKEIREFTRNGAIGSFIISELPPVDWASVIGLLLLGFGQLIAGAALVVFTLGAGASFGAALIAEGISDIISAVKDGIINRDFCWERWAIEKAISLTVSVICVGWVAMKDVAMTIRGGARIAGRLGRRAIPQAVKEGWKLVFRKVGSDLTKSATKEFVGALANYGVTETLIPWLQCRINEIIEQPIAEALEGNWNIKMMLELDKTENNTKYEDQIRKIGLDLLNPEQSSKNSALANFAKKMSNRILDHKFPHTTTYRKVQVLKENAAKALLELPVLAYQFLKDLNEAIEEIVENEMIEARYRNRGKSKSGSNVSIGAKSSGKKMEFGVDMGRFEDEEEQVKPQYSGNGALRIAKNYSNSITKTIVNVIQRDFVAPVVQMGVDHSVNEVMTHETETLNEYIETFKNRRRARRIINEELQLDERGE